MGPTSENAGYVPGSYRELLLTLPRFNGSDVRERRLCRSGGVVSALLELASMGPTSENAGYAGYTVIPSSLHGASMGPTSENAGYVGDVVTALIPYTLQWVRRPRTPVMSCSVSGSQGACPSFNGSDVRVRRLCTILLT